MPIERDRNIPNNLRYKHDYVKMLILHYTFNISNILYSPFFF